MFSFELMKTIAIFALITLVACDTINPVCHNPVTVSPANPVQFWPSDCQSFNKKEICGIYSRKYCQPWNCDDEIINQGYDPLGGEYEIKLIDYLGGIIAQFPFERTDLLSGELFPNLDEFVNEESGTSWTTGTQPSVSINIGSSKRLSRSISLTTGLYEITSSATVPAGDLGLFLSFYYQGAQVSSSNISNGSNTQTVSIDGTVDQVFFTVIDFEGGADFVQILSVSMIKVSPVYQNSFLPEDYNICDEEFSIEIVKIEGETETVEWYSDGQSVKTSHECSNLIEYSNNRNYAGLIYTDTSPSPSFKIRVRSIFFHEEFPQEDFVMELTSGIEKTSGVITAQRRFDVDRVPYYMHKKLILIFEHQSILINGAYWTKQERYEMIENQKQTFPMKKGQVLLTMRDFVQRSVL